MFTECLDFGLLSAAWCYQTLEYIISIAEMSRQLTADIIFFVYAAYWMRRNNGTDLEPEVVVKLDPWQYLGKRRGRCRNNGFNVNSLVIKLTTTFN